MSTIETQYDELVSDKVAIEHLGEDGKVISIKEVDAADWKVGYVVGDLGYNESYKVKYEAIPWNNSQLETSGQDRVYATYFNGVEISNGVYSQTNEVESGPFRFTKVPETLAFKTTPLTINLTKQFIDREEDDWAIGLEDYRGTNESYDEDQDDYFPDRQDWDMYATAAPFKDESGNDVSTSVLSVAYINGENSTELGSDAVSIESHSVENETPKEHHDISVDWQAKEGLKAHVNNRNGLKTNSKYQAQLEFELRMEP